ncbi:hypothetical protein DL770_005392 [Monosporascus sp. CRB-9-2]|nr:hypothetical protein DL770_005392 [Monosporascus sp. CRB-9-2]
MYFYASYDYKAPGVSGGGAWAYGLKKNGQKVGSPSQDDWNASTQPDKPSSRKDGSKNAGHGSASKSRNAASTNPSTGTLTSPATSTVSQTEAHGHITSSRVDEKVDGLDAKLENIQKMLIGSLDCQKDLRHYLKASTEAQSRLEATLDVGNQNAKLADKLSAAKDENTDLKLQIKDVERNLVAKCNNLEQDHRDTLLMYQDQQRTLESTYKERLDAAQKDHENSSKHAEDKRKDDIADLKRQYDDRMLENTRALEKKIENKNEFAQQLQDRLNAVTEALRSEHEKEMKGYEKDIQKLQEEIDSHKSDKTQLIRQYDDQVKAIRATENILNKIDNKQSDKDDLKRAHGEQLKSLKAIEQRLEELDARQLDKDGVVQAYEEHARSLKTIERHLAEIDARQVSKELAKRRYEQQVQSLKAIEKRLEEMDTRQIDKQLFTQRYEEQAKLLKDMERQLGEMSAHQVDKESSTQRYEEQVKAFEEIKKRLQEIDARQLDKEQATQRYEQQVQRFGKIETLLKEVGDRQQDTQHTEAKQKEQAEALATIESLIVNLDEHQLDKQYAELKHQEQIKQLRSIEDSIKALSASKPHEEQLAQNHQEQLKALDGIEGLIKDVSNQNLVQRHEEQIQELRMISDVVKELKASGPHDELLQNDQTQLAALSAIEKLVKDLGTQDFAQRHKEQIEELRTISDVVKNLNIRGPHEELLKNNQAQLEALGVIEGLVNSISAQDLAQRHEEQMQELRTIGDVVKELNSRIPQEELLKNGQVQLEALSTIEKLVNGFITQDFAQRHREQIEELRMIGDVVKDLDIRSARPREELLKNDQEQLEALKAIQKLVKGIEALDFSQRHTEQIEELRRLANVVQDLNVQKPSKEQLAQNHQEQLKAFSSLEELVKAVSTQDFAQRHTEQIEELRGLANMVKILDAQSATGEQLAQNKREQMKALSSLEELVKGISAQDFTQRHAEQIEELRKLADVVKTDLDAQKPNQERLAQNHQEQLATLNVVEELVKGISAQDFAQRHDEQVKSLIDIKRRLEEINTQQPDKEERTQKHEEQIRKLESLKDEFNTQLEKIESAMQKFGREQQDKEYSERKHRELLVALEKKQKVGPDEVLTSQLADIRQLLDKLDNGQQSIQSVIPEQLSQLRDENAQSNTLSAENVGLLSKLQEEKAVIQQQLQYVTNRLDQTTRDLEEAKSRAQDAEAEKVEVHRKIRDMTSLLEQRTIALEDAQSRTTEADSDREALEASRATWMRERDDLRNQLAAITDESERAHSDFKKLVSEKERMQELWEGQKAALEVKHVDWILEREDLRNQLAAMTDESARAHSDFKKLASEKDRMQTVWEGQKAALERQVGALREKTDAEEYRRRKLFEQVQTLRGNIRVMCRIRPPLPGTPQDTLVDFHPTKGEYVDHYQKIEVVAERLSATGQLRATSKFLECERIFTPEHTNKDVFEEISQLTMSALDGKKVCIFCYGQTGSGKTFTMNHRVGPPGHDDPNDGIIHRSLALMFEHVNSSREQYQYDMKMSIVEVYINDLIDLFSSRKKHVIKNMDEATGKDMTTQEAVGALIDKALNNRAVGATNANAQSSRSHLILCFKIERTVLKGPDAGNKSTGILNLIDLAGSEKNKETGATGQRLEESKAINSSIFELNNSITALAEGKPKRAGHTLTRVLDPCLAKGCRVVMFVMVSPLKKDQPETENTMTKAEMAAKAKLNSKASNSPTSPGGGRSQIPVPLKQPKPPAGREKRRV